MGLSSGQSMTDGCFLNRLAKQSVALKKTGYLLANDMRQCVGFEQVIPKELMKCSMIAKEKLA